MNKLMRVSFAAAASGFLLFSAACGTTKDEGKDKEALTGEVRIDGSSTVFPIMEAVSEEFSASYPDVKAPIGKSGTGGGFKKFVKSETDLSNASREIKEEEAKLAEENGITYKKLEVAFDGITIVVNKENDWAKDLTVEELSKIWIEDGTEKKWSDIRPEWPNEKIKHFSPGQDSGTYDYFDEVILDEQPLAKKATKSEEDNVLVTGVQSDKYAIGFFGYSYYEENQDKLTAVTVNGVAPSVETIKDGSYAPLSRPLFVYVNEGALKEKPQVKAYVQFMLENAGALVGETGYVALPEEKYTEQLDWLNGLK
ncbi:MAG: PstS family phosphate ABC transporter substrate-binding protein [Bacilli bacterium]